MTVMVVLWSLGSLIIRSPSANLLPTMVSWLCAVGLLLSSVLNGFGSVSLPHSCLVGLYLEPIGPEVIARAEVELEKASAALSDKRNELTLTLSSSSSDLASMKRRTWAASSRGLVDSEEDEAHRRQHVQREIEFLESLVDELTDDVADMKYAKIVGAQARTPMGKIRFYLGFVFSLILLIRLGTSFASIWNDSSASVSRRKRSNHYSTVMVVWPPPCSCRLQCFITICISTLDCLFKHVTSTNVLANNVSIASTTDWILSKVSMQVAKGNNQESPGGNAAIVCRHAGSVNGVLLSVLHCHDQENTAVGISSKLFSCHGWP